MDVSKNSGNPKSSILIGFSIINHPFWGTFIFGNTHQNEPWKRRFLLNTIIFRFHVSFRGGIKATYQSHKTALARWTAARLDAAAWGQGGERSWFFGKLDEMFGGKVVHSHREQKVFDTNLYIVHIYSIYIYILYSMYITSRSKSN